MDSRTHPKQTIGLIGYGRFGQLLGKFLQEDFKIKIYDPKINEQTVNLKNVCEEETLYLAVPIHNFANTISQIAPHLQPSSTVIDVCSVKEYPTKIMEDYLPKTVGILATHPMFGPDSVASGNPLTMMMHPARDTYQQFNFWKQYWQKKNMRIVEMTPEEHDRQTAYSQSITHLISRILEKMEIKSTALDTLSFGKLLEISKTLCKDEYSLFVDLLRYNRFTKKMMADFSDAFQKISHEINYPAASGRGSLFPD